MSHDFKLQYDLINESDKSTEKEETKYRTAGSARNVCFVLPDGKMTFLNYGYLVSADYLPEENTIRLYFTSHTVILKGQNLEELYKEFFIQLPMVIKCTDERYSSIRQHNYEIADLRVLVVEP